jgi:hypothetical protein
MAVRDRISHASVDHPLPFLVATKFRTSLAHIENDG